MMFVTLMKADGEETPPGEEEKTPQVIPPGDPPQLPPPVEFPITASGKQIGHSGDRPQPPRGSAAMPEAPKSPIYYSSREVPPSGSSPMTTSGDTSFAHRGPQGGDISEGKPGEQGEGYEWEYAQRPSTAQWGEEGAMSQAMQRSIDSRGFAVFIKGDGKAHLKFKIEGIPICVENKMGSIREGTGEDGVKWKTTMTDHYGYIPRIPGVDGDSLDVFVGPVGRKYVSSDGKDGGIDKVWVIHAKDHRNGKYDEDKVMLGFDSKENAVASFRRHYSDPDKFMGPINEYSIGDFKGILKTLRGRKNGKRLGIGRFPSP